MISFQVPKEKQPVPEQKDVCFGCDYEENCLLEHSIYTCLKDEVTKKTELKNKTLSIKYLN